MSLKFHFKLLLFYFTEETLFILFCKEKTIYFNFFDLMEGVYSTLFHVFRLQPIQLTTRFSKCILFVS